MTYSNFNKDATHFVRQCTLPGAGLCSAECLFLICTKELHEFAMVLEPSMTIIFISRD